tara:strand:+ start:270 stop:425 length:156 start_codon:yes stop_codon:yes gene_type:complete
MERYINKNKMTEEDIKYRQGRSREQYEASFKGAVISIIGTIIILAWLICIG